jgi:hypothetical protein
MGNLSNLYISQSYQSLIHLGNDSFVSSSLVGLQDGLGNSIGIAVNSAGDLSISGSLTSSLQQGYAWVGGPGNVTNAVPTSSFGGGGTTDISALNAFTASQNTKDATLAIYTGSVDTKWSNLGSQSGSFVLESETSSFARTDVNNVFGGNQTFNDIVVNGTASIAYLESVTGSAKIIGDAFIVLNNDTPTERYAGIIVIDSGSTNTTASFQYDGVSNDWFYEYTGSDPLNFGVALFGPEYGTKGSPIYNTNNRIVKGDGGHHIVDSNISDNGSVVSINSNTQITGSLLVNGSNVLGDDGTDTQTLNGATTINGDTRLNGTAHQITGSLTQRGGNVFITGSTIISGSTTINGTFIANIPTASSESQITLVDLPTFLSSNGTTYSTANFALGDFASAGIDQTFFIEYANDSFEKYSAMYVGPSRTQFIVGTGTGYDYDVIELIDNNNNTTTAKVKSDTVILQGSTQLTGSLSVSGSINTSVIPLTITSNTASLNAGNGNTFQLNLVSGSATRLEVSGAKSGQTINLLVSQSATGPGTLVFGDGIEQPSGSFYSASQVASGEDILTMATFINPNRLYIANIKNFI